MPRCFAQPSPAQPWRSRWFNDGLAFDVPALCGALDFCCGEEKERRLFERSEFASSPSLRLKFKEGVAISARLSFAYFSLARQRKVGRPRQGAKGKQTTKAHSKQKRKNEMDRQSRSKAKIKRRAARPQHNQRQR
jgi:hypothetical protein